MADWDEDSPQFRGNLAGVLSSARNDAVRRAKPTIEIARAWHKGMMYKLSISKAEYGRFTDHAVGRFRGEIGLEGCDVEVGGYDGVKSSLVAEALKSFEETLQDAVQSLDDLIAPGQELDNDQLAAAIELCAWAHSEWVRIHPFANGNGRTARLWSNYIAMRYGLPNFVRLSPRPDSPYDFVAADAMEGRWRPTALVFRQMYAEAVKRPTR
jgi:Fic/DOC family